MDEHDLMALIGRLYLQLQIAHDQVRLLREQIAASREDTEEPDVR